MKINQNNHFILIPFSYKRNSLREDSINMWVGAQVDVNSSILLPVVNDTLHSGKSFEYYSLDRNNRSERQAVLRMLLSHESRSMVQNGSVGFKFANRNMPAPALAVCPEQQLGILILPVSFQSPSLAQVCEICYYLRKLDDQRLQFSTSFSEFADCSKVEANPYLKKKREAFVQLKKEMEATSRYGVSSPDCISFSFKELLSLLLANFDGVEFYSPHRAILYSYLNGDSSSLTEEDTVCLLRLMHGLGPKYQVNFQQAEHELLWTFENVVLGTSCESGVLLTFADPSASCYGFFREFSQQNLMRYFWIYTLALIQQQLLIVIARKLPMIEVSKKGTFSKYMTQYYEHITHAKTDFHFVELSSYSHLNRYYSYCLRMLHVDAYYESNQRKLDELAHIGEQYISIRRYKTNVYLGLVFGLLALLDAVEVLTQLSKLSWLSVDPHKLQLMAIAFIGCIAFLITWLSKKLMD